MKAKTKTKIMIVLILLLLVSIGVIGYGYKILEKKGEEISKLTAELTANKQTVYVAMDDINKGDKLYADGDNANLMKQQIYTGLEPSMYFSDDQLGQIAIVDIPMGTPVLYNMGRLLEINQDTREVEIVAANLMTTQKENDVVDVRITYPNGEDYIVLAKKPIHTLKIENSIFETYLSEEEILRYMGAVVDAFKTTGARIWTSRYVEDNLQDVAIPTYKVPVEILDLIYSDPNVVDIAEETLNVKARQNLEERLGELTQEELDAVNEGFGLQDTARSNVLIGDRNTTQGDEDIAFEGETVPVEDVTALGPNVGEEKEKEKDIQADRNPNN